LRELKNYLEKNNKPMKDDNLIKLILALGSGFVLGGFLVILIAVILIYLKK